jgi:hypothetical protein
MATSLVLLLTQYFPLLTSRAAQEGRGFRRMMFIQIHEKPGAIAAARAALLHIFSALF